MPTSDRAIQMRNFAEGEGLMTNARCLTEGVDLPAIDCVVFTDPKRSKVDIVQAAGRALRLSKGKKFGYILIPIFIPDGADFNEAAEEQGFDDVVVTVRALATTDTRITEYLRVISEGKKPKSGSPVDGLTSVNSLYKVEAEEFDKAIKLKIWDKVAITNYRNYQSAENFAKSLNFTFWNQWKSFAATNKKPKDIPSDPRRYYKKNGWTNVKTFLGSKNLSNKDKNENFPNYEDAKKQVKEFKITSARLYFIWKKENPHINLPYRPSNTYKNKGWINWGDYLGTKNISDNEKKEIFSSYEEAKMIVSKENIKSLREYENFINSKKADKYKLPKTLSEFYKNRGWISSPDFFGTDNFKNKEFPSYDESKSLLENKNLDSKEAFEKWIKNNNLKIPKSPWQYYQNKGWISWPDFLGYSKLSFENLREIVQTENLKTHLEFKNWRKKQNKKRKKKIPKNPDSHYTNKKQWKGWPDFLGKKTKS
jgi:hypothetical protein